MSATATEFTSIEYAQMKLNELAIQADGDEALLQALIIALLATDDRFLTGCATKGLEMAIDSATAVKH